MTHRAVCFLAITLLLTFGLDTAPALAHHFPTPSPGRIVFSGRVPAPPGTLVRLAVLDPGATDLYTCVEGPSYTKADDTASTSSFLLFLARACTEGHPDVTICWADNLCDIVATVSEADFPSDPAVAAGQGLRTVETGLLAPSDAGLPTLEPVGQPIDTSPASSGDSGSGYGWLLWTAVIGAAVVASIIGAGYVARRLGRPTGGG